MMWQFGGDHRRASWIIDPQKQLECVWFGMIGREIDRQKESRTPIDLLPKKY